MSQVNQFGLQRLPDAATRREIRQRSKFGCVICREGLYHYEHIDPPYENARTHDPAKMCCLCGKHHDAVTRKHLSKAAVAAAYARVQRQTVAEAGLPFGEVDLSDGHAELVIGGLKYSPWVRTILRFHGVDVIRVDPGEDGEFGSISATFTDEHGSRLLWLENNAWFGSLDNWDIEIQGSQVTVRRRKGEIVLQFRLEPPGRVVIERLDMKLSDGPGAGHVLATEHTHAFGRYMNDGTIYWCHADVVIPGGTAEGVGVLFCEPEELAVMNPGHQVWVGVEGAVSVPLGIAVAHRCGQLRCSAFLHAPVHRTLSLMRQVVFHKPESLAVAMMTGSIQPPEV